MIGKILRQLDKTLGYILYLLVYFLGNIIPKKSGNKNILVIKLWAIGESVLVLPSLRELKKLYPDHKIFVLCTDYNKSVFENCEYVDDIISFNISNFFGILSKVRKHNFYMSIDFEPYTKFSSVMSYLSGSRIRLGFSNRKLLYTKSVTPKKIHAVENYINLISLIKKIKYPNKLVKLIVNKKSVVKAKNIIGNNKKIKIGIHAGLGSSSSVRGWDWENFAYVANKLYKKYNADIFIFGTSKELQINSKIISKLEFKPKQVYENLSTVIAVLEKLDLFIANDSGPMHIAASMGVPTIGIFGPNMPKLYGPYGKRNIGLYKGPNNPCIKPFEGKFPEKCSVEYDINKIEPEEVVNVSVKILKRARIRP